MDRLFFAPDISDEKNYTLSETESCHAVKVLRLKTGDRIHLIDGKGSLFDAIITSNHSKRCEVLIEKTSKKNYREVSLSIAIAPTKNSERIEWFVEKTTEMGIEEITPLICERSERKKVNHERLIKRSLSAVKQSLKVFLPKINECTPLKELINNDFDGDCYIASCDTEQHQHLKHYIKKSKNVQILIGPEGDFSKGEMDLAIANGFTPVSLGTSRLRTETAGILACCLFNLANE